MKASIRRPAFLVALVAAAQAASCGKPPEKPVTDPVPALAIGAAPTMDTLVDVYVGGESHVPVYRIPALAVSTKGTLLAFAEGRPTMRDNGQNEIVLKRSTDGGRTWGAAKTLYVENGISPNNPCATVVATGPRAGRIILMFQRYPLGIGEGDVGEGLFGARSCRSAEIHSDDDGVTWSAPRDLTEQVKRPKGVTSIASGPGVGIQLRQGRNAGRLVVPFNQGPRGAWRVYAALSDDGGDTWRMGDLAPDGGKGRANEVQLVETTGGELLMVARQENGGGARKVTRSTDGGEHWSKLVDDPSLPCPSCMGGIAAITPERLVFTGPNSRRERKDGTAWFSFDGGRTWPTAQAIYGGVFAYSQPALLPDGSVGVLFERDGYRRITLARLAAPTAPAPTSAPTAPPAGTSPQTGR